ncbi:MAG TPA: TIR domain-containing protein [Lacunisphaera sp.]|nr:TIR domain-containing protein [Lacunisphaera sp.]
MPDTTPAQRAVFLSYAREDTGAARRIADAMRAFGVDVWFDQSELRGGDSWDAKIKKQVRECALFIPIISATTQARGEGYFRREWKLAIERTQDMAAGMPFLVPVVIDDTPESAAQVPEEFMRVQWTRLARGVPTPQFVEQVRKLLEKPQKIAAKTVAGLAEAGRPGSPTPATSKGIPGWMWPALAVVIVAVAVGVITLRKPEPAAIAAETKPVPAPLAVPRVSDKSIAVLPFTNMSEDKDNVFFADGIHEDILTNLALIHELRVVSRTSVMPYRTTSKSMRQIAEELGVAYILEGSVRRAGNKVRVTGQLIRATTDEHVWAKAYDRDITDIFAIQSELSHEIAAALSAALSPQEKQLLDRRPTENLAAYDAYLKARELRQRNQAGTQESEPLLEEAVRLDPKFALAWAELASAMTQSYFNDVDHSDARLAKAKAAIDTAVRLAPDDPDIIDRLGDYYYYGYRDFARATEQYLRLAVLRPNDAAVFGSLGFIHRRQGRWGEALKELQRAAELEPRDLRYGHTLVSLSLGLHRYEEAAARQEQIPALFPDSLLDILYTAAIRYLARGSQREGEDMIARLRPDQRDQPAAVYGRKQWARLIGDWEESIKLDGQLRYYDGYGESHWSQDISAAFVLWAHGDQAAARALATSAIREGKAELAQKPSATAWAWLAGAYALIGNKAEALRCAQTAKDLIPESKDAVAGPPLSMYYAQVLAWCGEKDRAIAELTRLLRTPFGENIHAAKYSPYWLPLHGDPRFEALLNDPKNNEPLF